MSSPSNRPKSADVHPGPGFRIRTTYPLVAPEIIQKFRSYDVPDISDLLNRLFALAPAIRCLNEKPYRICGVACTVRVFPGDNLMVHKALDIARRGDIIVVDGHGEQSANAVLGDLISAKAKHRGLAGFIVDGLVRDISRINELEFPVFARGSTALGPLHRGPGEINFPISCGGVVVNPGDVVVADMDGIVVVPHGHVHQILERLKAQRSAMESYFSAVRKGNFSNTWVDELLHAAECEVDASDGPANSPPS